MDNVLIYNAAEGEKLMVRRMGDETKENHQQQPEEAKPSATPSTVESCLGLDVNFPRNKRKRGERKTGSDVWSKKCSGEPGSQ